MKDKLLQIRVDAEFHSKLEYLQSIHGYRSIAETIRKIIEKEYRKESVIVEATRVDAINETCTKLDCLLTNSCDFIFSEDTVHDAIEREEISRIINEYMASAI